MKYMGSKRRIAKYIIPIMLKYWKKGQTFYDLFCGGGNLCDKIPRNVPVVANDINKYVIALFKEMQKDSFELPEHISEENYKHIKDNKDEYPDWLVGYVGFNYSFQGMFFSSYAGEILTKDKTKRDYGLEGKRNIYRQSRKLKRVTFYNTKYNTLNIKPKSIIYCDPPYANTTTYKGTDVFNHTEFWDWCRLRVKEGHSVFISEYNAPKDFKSIWTKDLKVTISTGNLKNKTETEHLFVHESVYNLYVQEELF